MCAIKPPQPATGARSGRAGCAEPAALRGATAAHNRARAAVRPPSPSPLPALHWDCDLQTLAQEWADRCEFKHSHGATGENLFAGTAADYDASFVVDSWVAEKKDFSLAGNSCRGMCGHYTQVVWADTLRVGCAMRRCTRNSPFGASSEAWQLWVCEYDPPGNYAGRRPYGNQ